MLNMLGHIKRKGKKPLAHFMCCMFLCRCTSFDIFFPVHDYREHVEANNFKFISKRLTELAYNAFQTKRTCLMNTKKWNPIVIVWPQQLNVAIQIILEYSSVHLGEPILRCAYSHLYLGWFSSSISLPSDCWSELSPFSHVNQWKLFC